MEFKYPCRSVTFAETAAFPSGGAVCSTKSARGRLFYSIYHTRFLRGVSWAAGALVGPFPVKLSYAAVPT